jgi:IS30 family transposase
MQILLIPTVNGLIRRYFPRGTDFHLVSQGAVNEVVIRLNDTLVRYWATRPP